MQFLKEQLSDFWQYFKMFGHSSPVSSKVRFRQYVYLMIVCIVAIIFSGVHLGDSEYGSINYPVAFLVGFAIAVGFVSNTKPTLISVSPFSPVQRTVFNYLLSIVYTIIYTLLMLAVMGIFILIAALIVFLSSGENILVAEEVVVRSSFWGNMFSNFYGLYLFFSIYTLSHISRRRIRNIITTVWYIVSETLTVLFVNIVNTAANGGVYPGYSIIADLTYGMDKLAQPWLPSLIMGLITLAAFGISIYISYLCHRSRKF